MITETEDDLRREQRAIELYAKTFSLTYQKLDRFDIDYRLFNRKGDVVAYAEVKGRVRTMHTAYPLPVSAKKFTKLLDKRLNPIIIWACEDGIIYAKATNLEGSCKIGGRTDRGAPSDEELMLYFDKQKSLKYIRFT